MKNKFIDEYARNLSVYDQAVFVALSRHAGGPDYTTFVGCRKIAEELNINKNTVAKSIKNLIAYNLLRRAGKKKSGAYILKIIPVPFEGGNVYDRAIHKDNNKEYIKEGEKRKKEPFKGKELALSALKESNPNVYKSFQDRYN